MELDPEFSEFIASCAAREVRYLIVGGYALAAHGHPRFTKDLEVWVWMEPANAARLVAALEDFGFGSLGLTPDDFSAPGTVIQLGYAPKRIDLLTSADGLDFESSWDRRVEIDVGGQPIAFVSAADLIANKQAVGRLQDLADVEVLQGRAGRPGDAG